MNVLIKRLEIPEEGAIRVVIQKHRGITVAYTGGDPYRRAHEVVELPEKHGRLVDADALIAKCGDWYTEEGTEAGFIGTIKMLLEDAPTIVEAEGEDERRCSQ